MSDSLSISVDDENVEDIDSILSQIPLLEIGGKYTITDCTEESMIEEEEEEEKMKQRTEKEIEYLQSERNEQRKTINIKIGKEMMEEQEENVERELREKKRKIDMKGREIEMKLRELTKKKNAEMEKKKKVAELLRYRKYPENKASDLLRELEKRAEEARYTAFQARKNSTTIDKLVTKARQHLHMLRCRRVAEEQKEKNSNSAGKK
ncbi:stress response protein NST1-like [Daphnia magna]|uniref:stress response protein NST1-like n=1 Tax=Daphnia magna TaxID=35525 RepID=UPI001E1BCDCC|nr:stress response protein NST1-like [Daphnia magna]